MSAAHTTGQPEPDAHHVDAAAARAWMPAPVTDPLEEQAAPGGGPAGGASAPPLWAVPEAPPPDDGDVAKTTTSAATATTTTTSTAGSDALGIAMSSRWPLLGRDRCVTDVTERLEAGGSVVLSGPAGVGKSRLLTAIKAAFTGPSVSLAGSPSTAGLPLGAVMSAFPALGHLSELSITEVRREVTGWLLEVADGQQLLLTVDDAHLIDATTARGLYEATVRAPWCRVLMTIRDDVPASPGVSSAWNLDEVAHLPVAPLDGPTVEQLIATVLGGEVDAELVTAVRTRADGVPLTVVELLRGGLETGAIHNDGGVWRLISSLPTHRLTELVTGRLDRLSTPLRREAELIAHGSPLPARVAAEVTDPAELSQLIDQHVVRWAREGDRRLLVLDHPVHGDALRATTTPTRRRRILDRLACAFERTGYLDVELLRVAAWRLEVGGGDAALFTDAAGHAYASSDYHLAERCARAAIERDGGFRAYLAAGASLVELGDHAGGRERLAAAGGLAGSELELAWAGLASAHARWRGGASHAEVTGDLQRLRDRITSPEVAADVDAYQVVVAALAGDLMPARAGMARVMASAEVSGRARLMVATGAAVLSDELADDPLARACIDTEDRLTAADHRALPLGREVLRASAVASHLDPRDGTDALRDELDRVLIDGGGDLPGLWLGMLGQAQLQVGAVADAERHLREAVSALHSTDTLQLRPVFEVALATALVRSGLPTAARAHVEAVRTHVRPTPRLTAWSAIVDTEVAAFEGGPDAATERAVALGDETAQAGLERAAVATWAVAVRVGQGVEVVDRLADVADRRRSRLAIGLADAARAQAAGDAAALEAVARRFAAAGRTLLAAELAALTHRHGAGHPATSLTAGLLASCPGAATFAVEGLDPVVLPPGLRRAARAAAAGERSRDIADQLDRSIRTVDNQLGQVYRLLGVRGRRELARCYRPDQPPLRG